MKRKLILSLSILLIIASLFAFGCAKESADTGEDKRTIAIGKVPYTHEWIPAHIIKNIAEEMGYSTKMVEGEIGFMFVGLAQGDIDVFPDVWLPTLHKTYIDKYQDKIDLAGVAYEKVDIGWAVPKYVDVDTIEDLQGKAEEFDNRIVGIEPSTGIMLTSEKTIEAYGLSDFELLEGSTPAMLAELDKAIKNNEPIVFLGWRPHTMFSKYDIKLLKDTKDIWTFDDVHVGTKAGLKEDAPDLYQFLQNFKVSMDDIEKMLVEMEENKRDVDELTKEWIEQNRNSIDEMLGK